eukprot:NODE_7347_length_446_cov_216.698210.p3 GENE.NODE_7347_length_446_cov_216.698210~~NODE_7347_length_446_cov_216.698210.p3  ORF type:complete len:104 (+),score=34.68 NODE_7347_length_446_cov_216.698210:3-314(+)
MGVGDRTVRTSTCIDAGKDHAAVWTNERMLFPWVEGQELMVRVFNQMAVRGALMKDPLLGEVSIPMSPQLQSGLPQSTESTLTRECVVAGKVQLRLQLLPPEV